MRKISLNAIRFSILIQSFVTLWFLFTPDSLPEPLRQAEIVLDSVLYKKLDHIVIYLIYIQTFLCLLIWYLVRLICYGYLLITLAIAVIGLFSGATSLSGIDAFFSYLQLLFSGVMLGILWIEGLFDFSKKRVFLRKTHLQALFSFIVVHGLLMNAFGCCHLKVVRIGNQFQRIQWPHDKEKKTGSACLHD